MQSIKLMRLATRFRGLLPVVIDIETSGLDPATNALLELAAVYLDFAKNGKLYCVETCAYNIEPFIGATINPESLAITGIDPTHPFREAIPEKQALHLLFQNVATRVARANCQRAVLVGHNAWFDLAFLHTAARRCQLTVNPFHGFTSFDTASLAALTLGETVLARAVKAARLSFDVKKAHSAVYDAERTAELFCYIVNNTAILG